MKGIVFNILEDFLDDTFGEGLFDSIVENIFSDGIDPFVGPGTYPDEYLFSILKSTIDLKSLDLELTLRSFGKYMFGKLAAKYPQFVRIHDHPKELIKTIDNVIHIEVKKLFPEAETPTFKYSNDTPGELTLRYESNRNLFSLAEGLIDGAADHYKSPVCISRLEVNPEENYCLFHLEFTS